MVGHIPLEDGIGVRVPGRQQPSAERGRTEASRPNVQSNILCRIYMKNLILALLLFPSFVFAQSDGTGGTAPAPEPSVISVPAEAQSTPATVRTAEPTSTPTPSVSSVPSPQATPDPSVDLSTPTPEAALTPPTSPESPFSGIIWSIVILAVLGFLSVLTALKMKFKDTRESINKCDSIKEILEQKKRELEEMIKNYPKDKLKEIVEGKITEQLEKNEDTKKILSIKKKYDKTKSTIELLQKKYDLCMLSLPKAGELYQGTVVENSLENKEVLKKIKITKNYNQEDWMLHDVEVSNKEIEELNKALADGPWYMNFWKKDGDEMIVVFKERTFKMKASDKTTWNEAIEYGKSKGIPEEQLDFQTP
jgi:hypothetical protein